MTLRISFIFFSHKVRYLNMSNEIKFDQEYKN